MGRLKWDGNVRQKIEKDKRDTFFFTHHKLLAG